MTKESDYMMAIKGTKENCYKWNEKLYSDGYDEDEFEDEDESEDEDEYEYENELFFRFIMWLITGNPE